MDIIFRTPIRLLRRELKSRRVRFHSACETLSYRVSCRFGPAKTLSCAVLLYSHP